MHKVDVFIPVYNDITFLPAAVSSVLAQSGVDVRIIVSDNASNDGSWQWLLRAAASEPRIVLHRNERNLGLLGNLNRFRDLVEAPYYMLLCSDDVLWASDALAKAAAVANQDPQIVSVYCDLAYIGGSGQRLATRRFRRNGPFDAREALRVSLRRYRNMFGIPLLNRTDVHRSLSYPEGLTYTGDVHLSMQAAQHGPVHHIGEVLIGNRYTGANITASVMRESRAQFARLEEEFGIELSAADRFVQRVNYPLVMFSKWVFLAYARMWTS